MVGHVWPGTRFTHWRGYPVKQKVRQATGQMSIKNANLHNLKNITVNIPTGVLTIVTGVAGPAKAR